MIECKPLVLGRGTAPSSNANSVGNDAALAAVLMAMRGALAAACPPHQTPNAVLGIAGSHMSPPSSTWAGTTTIDGVGDGKAGCEGSANLTNEDDSVPPRVPRQFAHTGSVEIGAVVAALGGVDRDADRTRWHAALAASCLAVAGGLLRTSTPTTWNVLNLLLHLCASA